MDYISDPTLVSDLERFARNMTAPTRERFFHLISKAVEAGIEFQERTSNEDDLRYFVP